MGWMTRRRFLLLAGAGAAGVVGLRFGIPQLMRPGPLGELSEEAQAFVEQCFEGIDRSQMLDSHVHLIGIGAGDTGCSINPEMMSHLHPIKRFQYDVFRSALGMQENATADADYVTRLLALHRAANPKGKLLVMAFDQHVTEDGLAHPDRSPFHTPDAYALELAARHRELVACASVHPYRLDAIERLDAAAAQGARAIKWLPNAMGIDPLSPLCDRFYKRLVELGLTLISHAGQEYAVDAGDQQELGNPLRLRRPLDAGVRIVVAHCASLGSMNDLDSAEPGKRSTSFDLFLRLAGETQYEKTLFADISTVTQINRGIRVLRELLRARELHPRLINGSDYPLPALRLLFSPTRLELEGLITRRQRRLCNEIGGINPLLFDFVLKRSVTLREGAGTFRFPAQVFESARLFS
jgi:mannonate dehydratase